MTAHQILFTLLYLAIFNVLIYRVKAFQFKNFKPFVSVALFNIKFVVGLFIWFIYTFYYKDVQNNDVHKFYSDALVLRNVASESPRDFAQIITGININDSSSQQYCATMKNWQRNFDEAPFNENRTVIRLNALLMFLSAKTYFVHILFMCFISLLGWILLSNSVLSFANNQNAVLVIPIMLLPSVLFWTSGILKEPLLVLGLGLFVSGVLNLRSQISTGLAKTLAGFIIILFTKFFVLACLLPTVVAFLVPSNDSGWRKILFKYAVVHIVLLTIAFNLQHFIPRINLPQMLANKQMHSVKEAEYFQAGSRIEIPPLLPNAQSILKIAPMGLWNTLTRPYPWEGKNVMMLASALENLVILGFILLCIYFSNWKDPYNANLFLFLISSSLVYFALIGMCTPVLGNLVRYKAPLLPIFLLAFTIHLKINSVVPNFLVKK
ncbi:MAG: hypothetical protein JWO06_2152 [Bacteroidota bacterium]|nr:hypothetical protein [Bacteroidota bacterium]